MPIDAILDGIVDAGRAGLLVAFFVFGRRLANGIPLWNAVGVVLLGAALAQFSASGGAGGYVFDEPIFSGGVSQKVDQEEDVPPAVAAHRGTALGTSFLIVGLIGVYKGWEERKARML